MRIQEVLVTDSSTSVCRHFLCCHKSRCQVTQLLIRLEWIDPVLKNSSYALHYTASSSCIRFFPAFFVCCALIRGCGTCQFLTLVSVLSTVRSKYHPLEDCFRLQADADDASLGLASSLMVTSIVCSCGMRPCVDSWSMYTGRYLA